MSFEAKGFFKGASDFCKREAPTLMSIGALVGVAVTAFLAFKSSPKVDEVLKEAKEAKEKIKEMETKTTEETPGEERVTSEEIKKAKRDARIRKVIGLAKGLWPVGVAALATGALILGANHINLRRIAVYAGAYEVASGDLKKYKEKLNEVVGEKKAQEVRQAVSQEKVDERFKDVHPDDVVIYHTGFGDQLFYDEWTGRAFTSSEAAIERAFSECSAEAILDMFVSANELYGRLGLDPVGAGKDVGLTGHTTPSYRDNWVMLPNGKRALSLYYDLSPRRRLGDM